MPDRSPRRSAGRHGRYRHLIHVLNQRYRREWERAEALQAELTRLRGSPLGRFLAWFRGIKRALSPPPAEPAFLPWTDTLAGQPEPAGQPSGRVSIIIPFRDRVELLQNCLHSLRASTYREFETILVDNGSRERRTQRLLWRVTGRPGVEMVHRPGPFNFSRLCNEGAGRATGRYVLFLNNDTELLTPDWLERMLLPGSCAEIGVVGASLLYPDGTVQHAGIFPRSDGSWTHRHRGCPADHGDLCRVRSVPAVTGACLLMRRDHFLALGGFDERLPLTFGDVDLCRRVRERGLLVVVTPHARLLHFESVSRGYRVDRPGECHLAALACAGVPSAAPRPRDGEGLG
jgi:GT2 family glycosyltransferase